MSRTNKKSAKRGIIPLVCLMVFSFALGTVWAQEVIMLKYSCPFPMNGIPDLFGEYALNKIEEKSKGKIKFNRYRGGTLAGPQEHLDLVSTGSVDVVVFGHTGFPERLPLHSMPEFVLGSQEKALEFARKMEWEIPETSKLLQKEWEANNVILLGYSAAGENGFISKVVFNSIKELKGRKIAMPGAATTAPLWQKLGVTPVPIEFPDIYEGLARGLVDFTHMSLAAIMDCRWYEVAKCYRSDGSFPYAAPFVVNLKTWNRLSPDLQRIFKEAVSEAVQYSLKLSYENQKKAYETFKKAGVDVGALPKDEQRWYYEQVMELWYKESITHAKRQGKEKEAELIWKYARSLILGQ